MVNNLLEILKVLGLILAIVVATILVIGLIWETINGWIIAPIKKRKLRREMNDMFLHNLIDAIEEETKKPESKPKKKTTKTNKKSIKKEDK